MVFVRALMTLTRDKALRPHLVPIVADEARTFGMEGMFRQLGIYSSVGQLYDPVDAGQIAPYIEAKNGQILEEGITEAGSLCSWMAAGTSHSNHGVRMIPFYIFYSMFGYQRVGDFVWAAGDMRTRGFLLGGTSGRTTLNGEGLQHQDGHGHLLFSVVPSCVCYDPCYAYELVVILQDGLRRMYAEDEQVFYYITVMNENYSHPAMPEGVEEGIRRGMYLLRPGAEGHQHRVQLLGSGTILREVEAAAKILEEKFDVAADVWSVTSFSELRRDGLAVDRWNRLHPKREAEDGVRHRPAARSPGPGHRVDRLHEVVRRSDPPLGRGAVRRARDRRLRPLRHARGAAPLLRGRSRARGARGARRAGRGGQHSAHRDGRGDREARHRSRSAEPGHRVARASRSRRSRSHLHEPKEEPPMIEVRVPDIGDFDQVDVVEVLVEPGRKVEADESLITLESEKASMDVPAPQAGVVKEISVKVGDKVGEGDLIVTMEAEGEEAGGRGEGEGAAGEGSAEARREAAGAGEEAGEEGSRAAEEEASGEEDARRRPRAPPAAGARVPRTAPRHRAAGGRRRAAEAVAPAAPPEPTEPPADAGPPAHASPSVRQFARNLGVDVSQVRGTGPKGRIQREDVRGVRQAGDDQRRGGQARGGETAGARQRRRWSGHPADPRHRLLEVRRGRRGRRSRASACAPRRTCTGAGSTSST